MTASVTPVATNTTNLAALLFSGSDANESGTAFGAILVELTQSDEANSSGVATAVQPGADAATTIPAGAPAVAAAPADANAQWPVSIPLPLSAAKAAPPALPDGSIPALNAGALASNAPAPPTNIPPLSVTPPLPATIMPEQLEASDGSVPSENAPPPVTRQPVPAVNAQAQATPAPAANSAAPTPASVIVTLPDAASSDSSPAPAASAATASPASDVAEPAPQVAAVNADASGAAEANPAVNNPSPIQRTAAAMPAALQAAVETAAPAAAPSVATNLSSINAAPADKYSALRVRAAAAYAEAASLSDDGSGDAQDVQATTAPGNTASANTNSPVTAPQTPVDEIEAIPSLPQQSEQQTDPAAPQVAIANSAGSPAAVSFSDASKAPISSTDASSDEAPTNEAENTADDGAAANSIVPQLPVTPFVFSSPTPSTPAGDQLAAQSQPQANAPATLDTAAPAPISPLTQEPTPQPDAPSATPGALSDPQPFTPAAPVTFGFEDDAPVSNDSSDAKDSAPASNAVPNEANAGDASSIAANLLASLDPTASALVQPAQIASVLVAPSLTSNAPAPKSTAGTQTVSATATNSAPPAQVAPQTDAPNAAITAPTAPVVSSLAGQDKTPAKSETAQTKPATASRTAESHPAADNASPSPDSAPAPTPLPTPAPAPHLATATTTPDLALTSGTWSAPTTGATADVPVRLELTMVAGLPDAASSMDALALRIAARSNSGDSDFTVRLDPADLGGIEVNLHVNSDGQAQASLSADKPQTLDLLQRDSSVLERALKDAGLDLAGGLTFSLKSESDQRDWQGGASSGKSKSLQISAIDFAGPASLASAALAANDWGLGQTRLDITV